MSDIIKDFEQIDAFLTSAKRIDTFQHCHTVYDLFGINNKSTPYPDIEKIIDEFVKRYAGTNAPKFKIFGKTISGDAERIKRVLKNHQREYNEYLRENEPRAKQIRDKFNFCTKRDGRLDSEEKNGLIEEGKEAGLTETEVRALIAQWVIETGVNEVEARSGDETYGKTFSDFGGKTFYEILGVADDAEYAEIKAAYEREHVKYNTSRDKAKASARFFVVSEAWDCLKDTAKRREYDEKLKQPKTPVPTGTPRLVVECKSDYTFKDIRKGTSLTEKIVIKNPEGGLLQGTIKSDSPWLEPERNQVLEKHEQELHIYIHSSKISPKTYSANGNITIETNGGTQVIPFTVFLESYEIELQRFRKGLTVAGLCLGGLFGVLVYNLNYIQGMVANITGIASVAAFIGVLIVVLASKLGHKAGNNFGWGTLVIVFFVLMISEHFPHALSIISWALIYGSFANVLSTPLREALWRGDTKIPLVSGAGAILLAILIVAISYQTVSLSNKSKSQIRITEAVIAKSVGSHNRPLGVGSAFADKSFKDGKLFYYINYNGAIANQTKFRVAWYREGSLLVSSDDYTVQYATGNYNSWINYSFTPGNYEARLIVDGNEVKRTAFTVTASSADAGRTEETTSSTQEKSASPKTSNRFTLKDGIIDDSELGLQWAPPLNRVMNWDEAAAYVRGLSLAGGGWRLPTRAELRSLYNRIKSVGGATEFGISEWVWSSELDGPSHAWGFNFNRGGELRGARASYANDVTSVLAVRSRPAEKSDSPQASTRFTLKNGVIYDSELGLQWVPAPDRVMNHYQAEEYARNLSRAGGGWRLPTGAELKSLYDKSKPGGAGSKFGVSYRWVWTSELAGSSFAWGFDFSNGNGNRGSRDDSSGNLRVLAVRSSPTEKSSSRQASTRFTLKDGVIYDSELGLQWVPASGLAMTHYQAEEYARHLSLAGGGWRLPTRVELESLYDTSKPGGADPTFPISYRWVWTSELDGPSLALAFYFRHGSESSSPRDKSSYLHILAVRSRR